MLTVWCLCIGDKYPDYYAQRLKRTVKENLSIEHRFVCISDHDIEGVETIPPINDLPGWWGKTNLFSFDVCDDHNLYFDLDVVITGDLDDLVNGYGNVTLAMPLNWAASGHGGCQSSVMLWTKNYNVKQIHDSFDPAIAHWPPINRPPILWGDQEWITQLRDSHKVQVHPINEQWVKSYKYHCGDGLPFDCRVVVFHGEPKPADVKADWYIW